MRPLLACALLLSFVAIAEQPHAEQQHGTESAYRGRFQVAMGGAQIDGHILIDTETGQTWREITLSNAGGDDNGLAGKATVWVPMTRINSAKELTAFVARNPKANTEAQH